MSLSILGVSGAQKGIGSDETGINCSSVEVRYFPFVNDRLLDIHGEPRGRARSAKFSRDITLQGEILAASGVMLFTLATGCTLANVVNAFGDGTGTILMDEATVKQGRTDWETVDMKLSSDPGVILS